MKHLLPILLISVLIHCFQTIGAEAQPSDLVNTRLALHVTSHNTKGSDCDDPLRNPNLTGIGCVDYVTKWPMGSSSDVWYVLAGVGQGFSGVSSGIEYSPIVGVFGANLCATSEAPSGGWPASGSGNVITWDPCAGTQIAGCGVHTHAVAYVFYVYAYGEGTFKATENRTLPSGPDFIASNCNGESLSLWNTWPPDIRGLLFGVIQFGGNSHGYSPCGCIAVEKATWGKLKALYQREGGAP